MIPYIILYFSTFLGAFLQIFTKIKSKILFLFVCICLGILSGSRVYTLGGYDTSVYKLMYESTPSNWIEALRSNYFLIENTEKGYLYIMSLFKSINFSFNEFLLILGLISSVFLFTIFKNYSKYYFFTLLIFLSKGYLYYFFIAQRQILAMMICWFAIKFIIQKKIVLFFALIFLASLFHTSAIIFIFAYPIYYIRLNNKTVFIILIISIIIAVSGVTNIIGSLTSGLLNESSSQKLNQYFEGGLMVNILNFVELIPVLFFVMKNRNKMELRNEYFNLFFNFFIVTLLLTIIFYNLSFISRLKSYYIIGYIIILSQLIDFSKKLKLRNMLFIVISLYCFLVYIREIIVFDNGAGFLPYKAFWFNNIF